VIAASVLNFAYLMFVIAFAFVCYRGTHFFLNFTSLVAFVHHWYFKSSRRKSLHEDSLLKCTTSWINNFHKPQPVSFKAQSFFSIFTKYECSMLILFLTLANFLYFNWLHYLHIMAKCLYLEPLKPTCCNKFFPFLSQL